MSRAETLLRGLEAVGADRMLRPWLAGCGVIFVLHRAAPAAARMLDPDSTITADALDNALRVTRQEGYVLVALDEVPARLRSSSSERFAAFTFDDGYRDNLTVALPVFRAHGAPFCVYAATGLLDRTASYWWGALARVVESRTRIDLEPLGVPETVSTSSWSEKQSIFSRVEAWVHGDLEQRADEMLRWCRSLGVEDHAVLDNDVLTWDELRVLAHDPLVTIGAHGVTHCRLARLSDDGVLSELAEARTKIETAIGRTVRHLAYPYGGPAACGEREFRLAAVAGYLTSVTSRTGNLFASHAGRLTALPRQRLAGGPPDTRAVRRSLTGTDWLLRARG